MPISALGLVNASNNKAMGLVDLPSSPSERNRRSWDWTIIGGVKLKIVMVLVMMMMMMMMMIMMVMMMMMMVIISTTMMMMMMVMMMIILRINIH